jgi:hypothetical protein
MENVQKHNHSFTLVFCLAYSSTLKMEATCSSETSVDFQRTTRRYIPEDKTLHNHRCENLKLYNFIADFEFVRFWINFFRTSCQFHLIDKFPESLHIDRTTWKQKGLFYEVTELSAWEGYSPVPRKPKQVLLQPVWGKFQLTLLRRR